MSYSKVVKDMLLKLLWGKSSVPRGLYELNRYFRIHGPIHFEYKKEDGMIIAMSKDFLQGSIVTYAEDRNEMDKKIKDAILTAFEVPSSYAKEVGVKRVGESEAYALA
ncbi:MAG: hypothetical protein U9Q03_01860 [Patescibacteria group bacterium]|nr:hypothetical protein [Patescibacteria group bacterium]